MIAVQRLAHIREVLQDQGAATIQQLSDRVGASFSTIRRDLDLLARDGLVERTHGGATLRRSVPVAPLAADVPEGPALDAKIAIGSAAAEEIEDGQSVIFDSGLTVLQAARRVVEKRLHLTAVTNSIKTAAALAQSDRIRLIVVGGTLRPGTFTLVGEPGLSLLERLRADIALLNTPAVYDGRMAHRDMEIGAMASRMIAAAQRRVLLADSWKFGRTAFYQICPLTEFDLVITDGGISVEERQRAAQAGVNLQIATRAGGPGPTGLANS